MHRARTSAQPPEPLSVEWYQDRLLHLLGELWFALPAIGSRLFPESEATGSEGRPADSLATSVWRCDDATSHEGEEGQRDAA